jgi:hypothetical protein
MTVLQLAADNDKFLGLGIVPWIIIIVVVVAIAYFATRGRRRL